MKELAIFRKHLNEGPEPKSSYEARVIEVVERSYEIEVTIDEDLINELREYDYPFTWEEVQEQIKNDKLSGSRLYSALKDAMYEPEDLDDFDEYKYEVYID